MAVYSRQILITELLDRTEVIKAGSRPFLRLREEHLAYSPAPEKWSIAQVFGHLNLSNDIYIRSILPRVTLAPDSSDDGFRTTWLGEWAYGKIVPRPDGSVLKMRSAKSVRPAKPQGDPGEVIQTFLRACDAMDDILRHASAKDLRRIRVPFHFIPFLHFSLGETMRFIIAHNERHLLQAQRLMAMIPARVTG
ncbi:MAG TPA: DinB family protein [Puia sp.]|nr:DinB family protein [Puia sp.]